jgi:hypothetical protein
VTEIYICFRQQLTGLVDLPQPIRTPHPHKLLLKCFWRRGLAKGWTGVRDTCPGVFLNRRRVFSGAGALTKTSSANNGGELTQVGGVLLVVIYRSILLFCKMGPNLSQFHSERNVFFMAVIWTKGRMDCFVKGYYCAC